MKLPETLVADLIERWPIARLATVGETGAPHQVPIVFARVEDMLWSPVDGKPKSVAASELTRVVHLRNRRQASLLLDYYSDDWRRLWWLRLDVTATVHEVGPSPDDDPTIASALDALRRKYPQYRSTPILTESGVEPGVLLRFEVERARSWCPGPEVPLVSF